MFLPRILEALVPQLPQAQRNPPPRIPWVDHLINKPLARRHKRVRKRILVFLGAFGDLVGIADVLAEDDLDRALGAHHGDFAGGPGIVEVAAQVL